MSEPSFVPKSFLSFDGKDDFVALPAMNVDWSQGLTVEAWVRYETFNVFSRIIDFGNGAGQANIVFATASATSGPFAQVFSSQGNPYIQQAPLEAGIFVHLAVTTDPAGVGKLYRDGKLVQTGPLKLPDSINRALNYLGKSHWGSDGYFHGQLAEVRIWKTPRSEADIERDMNKQLTGSEPGLVVCLPLDDGSGTTARDRGPNGLHGTVNGATWGKTPAEQGGKRVVLQFPWQKVPDTGNLIGLAVLKDGTLLGIGTDNQLYTRSEVASLLHTPLDKAPAGIWTQIPSSGAVKAITQLKDGTLVGVGMDHDLWTRAALTSGWVQVPGSGAVKSVTQLPSGLIVGVGMNDELYTRETLTSTWIHIPGSGAVIAVQAQPDGSLLGIGADKFLYSRATLTAPWVQVPNSGAIVAISQLADGTLLGVGTNMLLYLADPVGKVRGEGGGQPQPDLDTQGARRSVLTFDGVDDCIKIGVHAQHKVQRDLTLEAWICATSQKQWGGIVSRIFDTGNTESGYGLTLDGVSGIWCGLRTVSGPGGNFYFSTGKDTLPLSTWHHVAATYDGKQVCTYIDGELKTTTPISGDITHEPDHALTIGAYADNDEFFGFSGKIAEVRIWKIVRTQAELRAAMIQALRGDEVGLVGYWPLDEGSGDTVRDRSRSGLDGKIAGAVWEKESVPFGQPPAPVPGQDREELLARLAAQDKCLAEIDSLLARIEEKLGAEEESHAAIEQRLAENDRVHVVIQQKLDDQLRLTGALHEMLSKLLAAAAAGQAPTSLPPAAPPSEPQPAEPQDGAALGRRRSNILWR